MPRLWKHNRNRKRVANKVSRREVRRTTAAALLLGLLITYQNCGKISISGSVPASVAQSSSGSPAVCSSDTPQYCTYQWAPGSWGPCSSNCGTGSKSQSQTCSRSDGTPSDPSLCSLTKQPQNAQSCTDYSGCSALACSAAFSPASVAVGNATDGASSTLSISAPTGTSGSYTCNADPTVAGVTPVTGTFQGSGTTQTLKFAYPTTCTVSVNRPDGQNSSCTAHLDVTCAANIVQGLYNATLTQKVATQDTIANDCVDPSMGYYADITFSPTQTSHFQKWEINCATRYCAQATSDPSAMGYINSKNMIFNSSNTALDPAQSVTVNCQYNSTQVIPKSQNVCQIQIDNTNALQTFNFTYANPPAGNPCGTTFNTVLNSLQSDPMAPNGSIGCGTAYCTGLTGQGFTGGALTDFNGSIFTIRCSRAPGLYNY